ncbi:MAG TPA: glycosyltransferase family 39 protein [Acidimicrobiales bacterium]|nr:glycosyltransferase family 39 protein [Acidimicrobiales bacterium]
MTELRPAPARHGPPAQLLPTGSAESPAGAAAESPAGAAESPRSPATTWGVAAVAAVVMAGVVLRFWARSDLWLDEALTVDIARLPLARLHGALRQDGAPPLYYVLLHFWMGAFGSTDLAVRALSGFMGVATLPVAWAGGRRLGGRPVAVAAVVLLASSPFAVRYSTENRMYALVVLLVAAGAVGLARALERPSTWRLVLVGLMTALLLYSHYWSLYLVATVAVGLAWPAWRGAEAHRRAARRALVAVALGVLTFTPWVPTFVFQARHTGTPWAAPADFAAMVNAVTSFAGGPTSQGRALALVYFALAGLGLFGLASGPRHVQLDLRTRPPGRPLALAVVGALALAVVGGYLTGSAFQARYASVVLVPLVLLVALGTATFADPRLRHGVLAAAVAFGLAGSVPNIWTSRTQAGQVAATLAGLGRPGDVIGFCPDQLGPAVDRLVPPGRYQMVTFPRGTGPGLVDWVDYAAASAAGDPAAFAARLEAISAPTHQIWLVWAPGYQTFGTKCEAIENALLADRSLGAQEVFPYKMVVSSWTGYEDMELVRFVHIG